MSSLSYILASRRHYRLLDMLNRVRLIWWAILGRPIIYGCKFKGGLELNKDNRNVYIIKNEFLTGG